VKPKIGIACQGGGSQTAFTAGVLKAFCAAQLQDEFEFTGISGTSGGAICATLMWYALRKGEQPLSQRLMAFWHDNTARDGFESLMNDALIGQMRLIGQGLVPMFQTSPSSPFMKMMAGMSRFGQRPEYSDFPALLRKHIDFDEIAAWGPQAKGPALILGAASVLSGRLRKFNSTKEVIRLEHILASAAVPNIFPAVEVDGDALWDGLFSDNPPIDDLVRKGIVGEGNVAQEIWVIKINPTTRERAPVMPNEIGDRRNQLEGNVSLFQNLKWLELINDMITMDAFRPEFLQDFDISKPVRIPKAFPAEADKPYHIPWIEMSEEMQKAMDYEGKLDRSAKMLDRLIAHGEERGKAFLAARAKRVAEVPELQSAAAKGWVAALGASLGKPPG
jgi:NTE family protein